MTDDLLITGFTAFGHFATNPAEAIGRRIAEALGARFEALKVCYDAVEAFVDGLQSRPPHRWVMFGVAGGSDCIRVETVARNWVGATADVRGVAREIGPISPDKGERLKGRLFAAGTCLPAICRYSDDTGDYLCNFIYWLATSRLPQTVSGFVHVAPVEELSEDDQFDAVLALLAGCA